MPAQSQLGIIRQTDFGRFILAKLHLDSLKGKRSPKAVKSALQNLRKRVESVDYDVAKVLDFTYDQALQRIEAHSGDQGLAKDALAWITFARRPLRTAELQYALAIETDQGTFDVQNISETEDIVVACAGLVTVDAESNIIRLVHYTTQEYLVRTAETWLADAQARITGSCITCLSFRGYENGPPDPELVEGATFMWEYAALNWSYHARLDVSLNSTEKIVGFLEDPQRVVVCDSYLFNAEFGWNRTRFDVKKGWSVVHLAVFLGLEHILDTLLKRGHTPDASANILGEISTPLWLAARAGHAPIVARLLQETVDVNFRNSDSKSILLTAVERNHVLIVKTLLQRPNVVVHHQSDGRSKFHNPLIVAITGYANTAIVSLLIAYDETNVNLNDDQGKTPLYYAIRRGDEEVVDALLAHPRLDINDHPQLLMSAAECGRTKMFTTLLTCENFNVNATTGNSKRTALHEAAFHNQKSIVRLLLARPDIHVNALTVNNETALHLAVMCGRRITALMLAAHKSSDVKAQDNRGNTPLHYAARHGYAGIVDQLALLYGKNINLVNHQGMTPLHYASECGHEDAVRALIRANEAIDVNARDLKGKTPLCLAVERGFDRIVELLVSAQTWTYTQEALGRIRMLGNWHIQRGTLHYRICWPAGLAYTGRGSVKP
jgi:ankyrin repeat protein